MRKWMMILLAAMLLASAFTIALAEPSDYMGKPMPDFTVQTIDGGSFTLSEALKDRDMVLINLWATWCPPCEMEFPYLEEAYEQYSDRVAVIALSIEPDDTAEVLRDYVGEHGMTFPVGSDSETGLAAMFVKEGIPTSVAVDRFGNVAFVEAGAQSSTAAFTALFDHFLDDDYSETEVLEGFPPVKPVEGAPEEVISSAANVGGGTLAFHNVGDGETWPMLPVEADGRGALVSGNEGVQGSSSAVCFSVTASEGDALAFDFRTSLMRLYDDLYVRIDGDVVKRFSGLHDWTTWAIPLEAGEHEIALGCENLIAGMDDVENRAWIDEVRVVSGGEASELLASLQAVPTAGATELKLADPQARRVELDDPTDVIRASFGVDDGWIIGGDSATAEVALEAGDDPETTLISTVSGMELLASEALKADGSGYAVTVPLEEGAFDVIILYRKDSAGDINPAQAVAVFAGEEGADGFVDYVKSYGYDAGWRYADAAEAGVDVSEGEGGYILTVVDQNGDPVPGVYVNFCTDDTCQPVQSDGDGVIAFTGEPRAYHLQILMVPEGYSFDEAFEAYIGPEPGELTIEVTRG